MVNLYRMRKLIRDTVKLQWRKEQATAKATKITAVLTGMPRGSGTGNQVEDGAPHAVVQLQRVLQRRPADAP